MIKSKFIIYGNTKTGLFPVVNGYVLKSGHHWFGIHRTMIDKENFWSLDVLYYGLRYKVYPTRKEAETAAKSKEVCAEVDRLLTINDQQIKNFNRLKAEVEQEYLEHASDPELNKMWYRIYEKE